MSAKVKRQPSGLVVAEASPRKLSDEEVAALVAKAAIIPKAKVLPQPTPKKVTK